MNGQLSGGTLSWVGNPDDWVALPSCVYAHHVLNLAFIQNPKFSKSLSSPHLQFFSPSSQVAGGVCVDWVSDNFAWWCEVLRLVVLINHNHQSPPHDSSKLSLPSYHFYSSLCNKNIVKPQYSNSCLRWSGLVLTIGLSLPVQAYLQLLPVILAFEFFVIPAVE